MAELHELVLLFWVAVFSASFLPSQAELLLFTFLAIGKENPLLLVLAATLGNAIGSLGNYYMGRSLMHLQNKPWFPIKNKYLQKPKHLFERHGTWTLLMAGIPFIGNPITLVAGILRVRLWLFIVLVTLGKSVRYFLVWAIYAALR